MLAQQGPPTAGLARPGASPPKPHPAAAPPPPPSTARKMSFKDKHALDTLPAQISKTESTIAKLRAALADPDLYTRDPKLFARGTAALEAAEAELAAQEERWLELEMLREEADAR